MLQLHLDMCKNRALALNIITNYLFQHHRAHICGALRLESELHVT